MKNLGALFEKYGIKLNKNQENQFDLFFHHLVETNKLFNLTAITEENDVAVKHFLDSALGEKFLPKDAKVVDVGSGAGFPAIPLKIVRPDIEIHMVDSLNKRTNFLDESIKMLGFDRAFAVHARAEEFAKTNREIFDVAVARAVAPLLTLVEYLLPLVKVGGQAIIYKSSKLDEELQEAQKAIQILGGKIEKVHDFAINEPQIDAMERKILIIKKERATPLKYPRPQNKPRTSPIS